MRKVLRALLSNSLFQKASRSQGLHDGYSTQLVSEAALRILPRRRVSHVQREPTDDKEPSSCNLQERHFFQGLLTCPCSTRCTTLHSGIQARRAYVHCEAWNALRRQSRLLGSALQPQRPRPLLELSCKLLSRYDRAPLQVPSLLSTASVQEL